jgi:hypothetical protein
MSMDVTVRVSKSPVTCHTVPQLSQFHACHLSGCLRQRLARAVLSKSMEFRAALVFEMAAVGARKNEGNRSVALFMVEEQQHPPASLQQLLPCENEILATQVTSHCIFAAVSNVTYCSPWRLRCCLWKNGFC